jgi:biopolymer transport protein ExbD
MTTASVQGVKVNLPKATKAPKMDAPKSQAITVNSESKFFLNTVPVTLAELESRLSHLKTTTPELPVVVRGDNRTQYESIMLVLDVLGRIGITQIGLATQPAQ